jgi:hypothetical protein
MDSVPAAFAKAGAFWTTPDAKGHMTIDASALVRFCVVALLAVVLAHGEARGGSIFDDDWTPAAPPATHPSAVRPLPPPDTAMPPTAPPASTTPTPADTKTTPPATDTAVVPPAADPSLAPIPTPEQQAKVRKLFKEAYSQQLLDRSAAGRRALAIQLLADAAKITDAPVDQFVMLNGARQAAIEASDVGSALSADEELRKGFLLDRERSRLDLLTRMSKTVHDPSNAAQLIKACAAAGDAALKDENYDTALQFAEAAISSAKTSGNPALLARANARAQRAQAIAAAFTHLTDSLAVLKKTPGDPAANLAVGRFYCLTIGNWEAGLPFLAIGSDATLQGAAKADLAALDAAAIAEQWSSLADKAAPADKSALRLRAATWYRQALKAADGLARVAVQSKLMALSTGPFRADSRELQLSSAQPADQVLAAGTGLAALGSIKGHFEGGGENAGVILSDDGTWLADGESHQGELDYSLVVYQQLDGLELNAEVKEYQWKRGEPKVRMIARSEGFCFLSHVGGHFEGGGESARVTVGPDGYWYLDCVTGQDLWVRAMSVKPRRPQVFATEMREAFWKQKSPPVRLVRADEGMCFLTNLHGGMRDPGDSAGLRLGDDGFWYLQGTGRMLGASAIVIQYLPQTR